MSRKRRKKQKTRKNLASSTPSKTIPTIILITSLVLVSALFLKNIHDGFLIDDAALIHMARSAVPDNLASFLQPDLDTYWRPVGKLAFVPDALLWKFGPTGYHLTSLALYLLVIVLLYRFAKRFLSPLASALAAALFAFHPLHAGTVCWISARYDLIATILVLGACLFFLRSLVSFGLFNTVAGVFCLAGAFLSKEIAFITPFLILLAAAFFGPSSIWNNLAGRWKKVLPYFIVAGVMIVLRLLVMGQMGGPGGHTGHPELLSPEVGVILGNYLLHFPAALTAPVNGAALGPLAPIARLYLTLFGASALAGLLLFRRQKEIWHGLLFGIIAAAPISFFASIGPNLESGYMLFLPSVGFALFVCAVFEKALHYRKRIGKMIIVGLVGWVIPLPFLLISQTGAFHEASALALELRRALVRVLPKHEPYGPVYCEGFPGEVKGVRIFFDEIDQLVLPLLGPSPAGTFVLVNENLLARHPELPPFRVAAQKNGFRSLVWKAGRIEDRTSEIRDQLARTEKSEQVKTIDLKVLDDQEYTYRFNLPQIEIVPSEVVPASSVDRLCLRMDIQSTEKSRPLRYSLIWVDKGGAYTADLPFTPTDDRRTCANLDRDPRWATKDILLEMYVRPHSLSGRIRLAGAQMEYRTKTIEIVEEVILDADDPFLLEMEEP